MKSIRYILVAAIALMTINVQAQKKYDYGTDSVACIENLSLFNEFIKQEAYVDAYAAWRNCVTICPASRKGLYSSGEKMFKKLMKDPANKERKAQLQDTLMMLYDMRIENFGQRGFVLGKKGSDMLRMYPDNICEAKDVLKESVDLRKDKSKSSVISNYYNALYTCYKEGNVELETLFTEYLSLSDYINTNIEKYGATAETDAKAAKELDRYVTAKNNLDEFFVQFAECDDITQIFNERINENPDDIDLKFKALRIMNRKECTESDLFLTVAKAVHEAQPSAESAFAIARKESLNKKYSTSLQYIKECLELCGECAERTNYLKYGGYVAIAAGDVSFARKCATEMQRREPKSGHAYILKGDAAKAMAKSCDDDKMGRYCAYWVAYDYYTRAKNVDSSESVQKIASQKMAGARGQFPGKEDVFFHGKAEGDKMECPCLGEATTVRTR
ncbi:MAG: hypothetical protein HKN45_11015 [Flavobacteriales bacterium]|nr:hypothetical protein [Flavobacteriales bacterium]